METVTYMTFIAEICRDFNIEVKVQRRKYFNEFPVVNGTRRIKANNSSTIVDKDGNEFPYMLSRYSAPIRNDEKLIDFDYIYHDSFKSLNEILKEANLELKSESCKIDEGDGWYSKGTRYYYKDFAMEM